MAPQDAAATLSIERFFGFSLLGLVASGYLAVAGSGYLDAPTIALTAAGLLLRAFVLGGFVPLRISERVITLACVAYCVFFIADCFAFSQTLLVAVVHLIFFLAVMKILTGSRARDHLFLAVVSFAELVAAAILSVNLNFFVFLACYLLFAIATLTSAEIRRSMRKTAVKARTGQKRFHWRLATLSVWVTLGILSLTAGLFFLLPRTADAALSRFFWHRIFIPGFSNQVTLGETGEIRMNSRPVMHIGSLRPERLTGLKWRGDALSNFNGKRWTNRTVSWTPIGIEQPRGGVSAPIAAPEQRVPGRYVDYEVEFDTAGGRALFFAGAPQVVRMVYPSLDRSETDSFRLQASAAEGFRYEVSSLLEDPPETAPAGYTARELAYEARLRNLQLPPLDPRIPALARSITARATTDLERARAIERRLRTEYVYSLEMPSHESGDPLSDFLFARRRGYCEYFASAMAVMLRSVGVPARIATGFQSGLYNPITGLWVIRASDAHAWVEAWIPGNGWSTFDPTPPDPNGHAAGLLARINLYLDAAGTFWQEWVVSYDPRRQGSLADRLQQGAGHIGFRWLDRLWRSGGLPDSAIQWLRRYGAAILLALIVGAAAWLAGPRLAGPLRMRLRVLRVRRGKAGAGDATVLYRQMLAVVKRRGYQKPAWFTPTEFAASLPNSALGRTVGEFTTVYNAVRFGGRTEAAQRLSTLLDHLESDRAEEASAGPRIIR
jgi:protein-glutamine gamma-glutamyltransferase